MLFGERYPDIEPIVKGRSFEQLFDLLYTVALVRYATYQQLNSVNKTLATKPKLMKLADLGYLSVNSTGIYNITDKALDLLRKEGYNTKVVQKKFTGDGGEHQLKITSVILKLMKEKDFYSVFYPQFKKEGEDKPYLVPDACVVFKNGKSARLSFLEVETEKSDWKNYLANKNSNYIELGRDYLIYDKWWRRWADILKFQMCSPEEFCFSVLCFGDLKFNWEGWEFSRL